MSLLKNKNNNSGINQINTNNNINNKNEKNNNENNNEDINEEDSEEEEEEEDDEEYANNNNEEEEDCNEDIEGDDDLENEEEEENEEDNLSLLESYKSKFSYIENIRDYPRPKSNFIIYQNSKKENTFYSGPNNGELVPSVKAYFNNIEEFNSSIKLIRPSQYVIPYDINKLKKSLNLFGINVEPFVLDEKQNNTEFIQKINIHTKNKYNKKILKCEHCNAFYHKFNCNYEMIANIDTYQVNKLSCLICKNNSQFYTIDPLSNKKYEEENIDINKIFLVPNVDCNKPSIEYVIKKENNNDNNIAISRNVIQIIIIDLSNKKFVDFIYQILMKILNEKENYDYKIDNENFYQKIKYILIAYDNSKAYYLFFNNNTNKTINITIMNDFKDPFCPVDAKKLIYNKKEILELLDLFYNNYYLIKNNNIKNSDKTTTFNIYDINNSIIKSVFHLIKINEINEKNNENIYYHIILISPFHHNIDANLLEQNKMHNIYLSFFLALNKSNKNIPFINNLNTTIAKLYYYQIDYDDPIDIEQKYQKLSMDLTLLLTNYKNYIFEIKMNICYDKNIFQNYFTDDCMYISFIPNINQFNKLYILPQYKKPNKSQNIYFQYNIKYHTLFDNNKHIRILTFINRVSDNQISIFKSYDEEVLFRTILSYHMTELNLNKNNFASINKLFLDISYKKDSALLKIIKEIEAKMKINISKNFRFGEEKNNIYIPLSGVYFPLYFYSFIKQISNGDNLNLFNLLYDSPITTFIKNIYPNLFSLGYKPKKDEEIIHLHPLTILSLERNQLLLFDDGSYITVLINNEINKRKKEHYFKKFDEKNKKFEFFSNNEILLDMIKDKPMKILYLDDDIILNKKILELFLEDIIINVNFDYDKIKLMDNANVYIQNDISYPNYYEILISNIYEYFE